MRLVAQRGGRSGRLFDQRGCVIWSRLPTAVLTGAVLLRAPADHFYGERSGTVRDPFGHEWLIGHSIEEVAPDEMQRRYDKLFSA